MSNGLDELRASLHNLTIILRDVADTAYRAHEMAWCLYGMQTQDDPLLAAEKYSKANPPQLGSIRAEHDKTIQQLDEAAGLFLRLFDDLVEGEDSDA